MVNGRGILLGAAMAALLLAPGDAEARSRSRRTQAGNEATLSREDAEAILRQAQESATRTASAEGIRSNSDPSRGPVVKRPVRMIVAVVSRDGKVLAVEKAPDAWVGSEDIAIAKARTAAFFSSDENALTSRIIGELSLATTPDGKGPGPLWGIGNSNQAGISGDKETRNGVITFPGGVPLYRQGRLVGGIGVSGDAVDQDEAVAFAGAAGFEPGPNTVKMGMKVPAVPAVETAVPTAVPTAAPAAAPSAAAPVTTSAK